MTRLQVNSGSFFKYFLKSVCKKKPYFTGMWGYLYVFLGLTKRRGNFWMDMRLFWGGRIMYMYSITSLIWRQNSLSYCYFNISSYITDIVTIEVSENLQYSILHVNIGSKFLNIFLCTKGKGYWKSLSQF